MSQAKGQPPGKVGVILVGHQGCAAALWRAVNKIAPVPLDQSLLADAEILDTSDGCDPQFAQRLRDAFAKADQGQGLLVLVDLVGSSLDSFCNCLLERHRAHLVSGLSLAMLLKLAHWRREGVGAEELAKVCADVGRRAIIHREPNGDRC